MEFSQLKKDCRTLVNEFLETKELSQKDFELCHKIANSSLVQKVRYESITSLPTMGRRNSGKKFIRSWKKSQVKKTVNDLRKFGVLPGSWSVAWLFIKYFVIPLIEKLLFQEVEENQ